jgi:hypothetical protein
MEFKGSPISQPPASGQSFPRQLGWQSVNHRHRIARFAPGLSIVDVGDDPSASVTHRDQGSRYRVIRLPRRVCAPQNTQCHTVSKSLITESVARHQAVHPLCGSRRGRMANNDGAPGRPIRVPVVLPDPFGGSPGPPAATRRPMRVHLPHQPHPTHRPGWLGTHAHAKSFDHPGASRRCTSPASSTGTVWSIRGSAFLPRIFACRSRGALLSSHYFRNRAISSMTSC